MTSLNHTGSSPGLDSQVKHETKFAAQAETMTSHELNYSDYTVSLIAENTLKYEEFH